MLSCVTRNGRLSGIHSCSAVSIFHRSELLILSRARRESRQEDKNGIAININDPYIIVNSMAESIRYLI
jgi:hypothetical protein